MAELPTESSDFPQRRRPAHPAPVATHNRPVILLVTVCLAEREPVLANARVHAALRQAWTGADPWLVGFYLIMPDHVHWFCGPGCHTPPRVKTWVKFWKSRVSRLVPELRNRWLPDCWDTQMRSGAHYHDQWEYVRQNPVRKGLARKPDDWPWQGVLNVLEWSV